MATWSNASKNSATWINEGYGQIDYLLKEDGDFLLQQNGYRIILEDSATETIWTNQTLNSSTWSNQTKN